jgi:tagatose 6-phosphate kinase
MILCIGPTPAIQRVMVFKKLAPDSVNRALTTLESASGKSINVAKVIKALGCEPVAVGFLGGTRGEEVRGILDAQRITHAFLSVPPNTRQCLTAINRETGEQTELVEESQPLSSGSYEALLKIIQERCAGVEAVVMSGTLTTGGPVDFYLHCVRSAHAAGVISILDARGPALLEALKAKPFLVKPNRSELAATFGKEISSKESIMTAARALTERGARNVVITAGAGATVAFDGKTFWKIHSAKIEAVNPIGSGDAFTAGFVCAFSKGDDFAEACRKGAAAGAANALTLMPGEIKLADYKRLTDAVEVERFSP